MKDGIRTRDRRDHNPELYQLSYLHHRSPPTEGAGASPAPDRAVDVKGYHVRGRASHGGAGPRSRPLAPPRPLWHGPGASALSSAPRHDRPRGQAAALDTDHDVNPIYPRP